MSDLKRYIIEQDLKVGLSVVISGTQYNHMANVIRQKVGDKVILLNGDGYDYTAEILEFTKQNAILNILEKAENERKTRLKLTVLCGLLKGDGSENQAVKLSELGVCEFVPFISENCVVTNDSKKYERLNRIALESSKQCKRAVPIIVSEIKTFKQALDSIKNIKLKIIAYENEKGNTLKNALNDVGNLDEVALIIGAEGGFTEEEINAAISYGCVAVTLGKTILKADTAAIASAAVVLYEAGEWSY